MEPREKKEKLSGVREYLEQYLELEEEIQCERDHLASLRAMVENCTTKLSFTAGCNPSKDEGRFENDMIDLVEEERRSNERIRQYTMKMAEIKGLVNAVPKAKHKKILRYKYLKGLKMDEILDEMTLTRTKGYTILDNALTAASKMYKKG